jgi:ATP-dependent RNA helicase DDX27
VLILDEADRMLSDGFAAELAEIIRACPSSGGGAGGEGGSGRQTMLFSATISDEVDKLVRLSMQRPIRLFVDPKKSLAKGLTQEFVRVKRENERMAILLALCVRTAKRAVIIFVRSKKLAHQLRVVFGILGLKATELHGDLTQEQVCESTALV